MSDCRFGVSPVNYPDPDPERSFTKAILNLLLLCMLTEYVQTSILLKTT